MTMILDEPPTFEILMKMFWSVADREYVCNQGLRNDFEACCSCSCLTGTFVKSFGNDIAKARFGNDIANARFGNDIAKTDLAMAQPKLGLEMTQPKLGLAMTQPKLGVAMTQPKLGLEMTLSKFRIDLKAFTQILMDFKINSRASRSWTKLGFSLV